MAPPCMALRKTFVVLRHRSLHTIDAFFLHLFILQFLIGLLSAEPATSALDRASAQLHHHVRRAAPRVAGVSKGQFVSGVTTPVGAMGPNEVDDLHAILGGTKFHPSTRRLAAADAYNYTSVCNTACQATQRDALLLLYNATGGGTTWHLAWRAQAVQPSQLQLQPGPPPDYCAWTGVRCCGPRLPLDRFAPCTVQHAVYLLHLENFGLSGTLPEGVFPVLAPTLAYLNFKDNRKLGGTLPADLATLTQLAFLSIIGDTFSGQIDTQLQGLTELQVLYLSGNLYSGSLPASLSALQQLYVLNLAYNQLTGTVPAGYSALTSLRTFDVANNRLSGAVPSFMLQLSTLRKFCIETNRFSGTIPPIVLPPNAISNFLLQSVMMAKNRIVGTFPAFINLLPVDLLDVSHNMMTGSFPQIGQVPTILRVLLNDNNFTGTLPRSFINPFMLELDVDNNGFSGTIPSSFATALTLRECRFSNNNFTGSLPPTASALMTELTMMDTNMVSLDSTLPPWLTFSNDSTVATSLTNWQMYCPSVVFKSTGGIVDMDPDYYQWHNCYCHPGWEAVRMYEGDVIVAFTCREQVVQQTGFPWYAAMILGLGLSGVLLAGACMAYGRLVPALLHLRTHLIKKQPPGGSKGGLIAAIVVTDVESSTELWEWSTDTMAEAIALHDHVLRQAMAPYYAYEVNTEGDAFIVAFHEAADAVAWCIAVQRDLMAAPWPAALSRHPRAQTVMKGAANGLLLPSTEVSFSNSSSVVLRQQESSKELLGPDAYSPLLCGLRVRMGMAEGLMPKGVQMHPVTKRREYLGAVAQRAHAVAELGAGGQILLDDPSFVGIQSRLMDPYFTKAGRASVSLTAAELDAAQHVTDDGGGAALNKPIVKPVSFDTLSSSSSTAACDVAQRRICGNSLASKGEMRRWWWPSTPLIKLQLRGTSADVISAPPSRSLDLVSVDPISPLIGHTVETSAMRGAGERNHDHGVIDTAAGDSTPEGTTPRGTLLEPAARSGSMDTSTLNEVTTDEVYPATKLYFEQGVGILVIDMGVFELDLAAVPEVVNVVQVLVPGLCGRGRLLFPAMALDAQIMPGFFDAPGALSTSLYRTAKLLKEALPPVTLVFCTVDRYLNMVAINVEAAHEMLSIYNDTVRRTLLAVGGYECQEMQGAFMIAFADAGDAMEWCLMLQEVLMEVCWPDAVLSLPDMARQEDAESHLLWHGPRVKMGLYESIPTRVIPHCTTGRADYFGTLVNRAARFCHAGAHGGQIVASMETVRVVVSKWLPPHQRLELEQCKLVASGGGSSRSTGGSSGTAAVAAVGGAGGGPSFPPSLSTPSTFAASVAPSFPLSLSAAAIPKAPPGPPRWRLPRSRPRTTPIIPIVKPLIHLTKSRCHTDALSAVFGSQEAERLAAATALQEARRNVAGGAASAAVSATPAVSTPSAAAATAAATPTPSGQALALHDDASTHRLPMRALKSSPEAAFQAVMTALETRTSGSGTPTHRWTNTSALARDDSVSTLALSSSNCQHVPMSSLARRTGVHKWLWAVSLTVEHLGSYRFKGVAGTHDVVSLSTAATSRRLYTSHKRSKGKLVVPGCGVLYDVQLGPQPIEDLEAADIKAPARLRLTR